MSYEGYSQLWCKNGHYWTLDCNQIDFFGEEKEECPICDERCVVSNMVDITNGSFDDDGKRIDGFIQPVEEVGNMTKCYNCGKERVCKCSTYKIPKPQAKEGGESLCKCGHEKAFHELEPDDSCIHGLVISSKGIDESRRCKCKKFVAQRKNGGENGK